MNTLAHRVNIDQFPTEEWERILRVDLTGLFQVSRAGAKLMLAQKSGRIINIASVLGLVPARLQCAFVAAKAGVVNLTKAMALELGAAGRAGQLHRPGLHPDRRNPETVLRRGRQVQRPGAGHAGPHPAGPARHAARKSRTPRFSWRRRRVPTSTAPC